MIESNVADSGNEVNLEIEEKDSSKISVIKNHNVEHTESEFAKSLATALSR